MHSLTQSNLVITLGNHVASPCEAHGSGLKVVARTRVRYPDATELCGGNNPLDSDIIKPKAVFEVLPPSTAIIPLPETGINLPLKAIYQRGTGPVQT